MDSVKTSCVFPCGEQLQQEFRHLRAEWGWLFLFGLLLVVCGTAAVVFPIVSSVAVMVVLGVTLMVAGMATIVTSFWAGKWGGLLVQLLVGILYLTVGFLITEKPVTSAIEITLLVAAFFIVAGIFRTVAALVIRFPHWGWAMLNGVVTFLLGMMIYRHLPQHPLWALWILGLLVGLEMLFNGWTWIMLSLAVRRIPAEAA